MTTLDVPTVSDTERIERLEREVGELREELRVSALWQAEHDGKINEKWKNQEQTNAVILRGMRDLRTTMEATNRKVWMGVGGGTVIVGTIAMLAGYLGLFLRVAS